MTVPSRTLAAMHVQTGGEQSASVEVAYDHRKPPWATSKQLGNGDVTRPDGMLCVCSSGVIEADASNCCCEMPMHKGRELVLQSSALYRNMNDYIRLTDVSCHRGHALLICLSRGPYHRPQAEERHRDS